MVTDENYNFLSSEVYLIDSLKKESYNVYRVKNNHFETLKIIDNPANGLQAAVVAPIVNGKVDYGQIIIAYAGTNPLDMKDLSEDRDEILGFKNINQGKIGAYKYLNTSKSHEYQTKTAKKIAEGVKTTYPKATITTTGHSLGGYLANVVAATNH